MPLRVIVHDNEPQTTPSPPRAESGGCAPNAIARNERLRVVFDTFRVVPLATQPALAAMRYV